MARNSKLKVLKKLVNDKHGAGTMSTAMYVMDMPRLSTGSLSFDRALGGGIPAGRTTIFRGSESSGKTTNAYRVLGLAQNICANCYRPVHELEFVEDKGDFSAVGECDCFQGGLFETKQYPDEKNDEYKARIKEYEKNSYEEYRVALIDMEGAYDKEWAAKLGVDDRRLVYVRPDTAEEAMDIYDNLLRTGEVDLLVLDSIAAMTPSTEVTESLEKWQQGLQARLMGKFSRKTQSGANSVAKEYKRLPTQLWINQEREKIGVMFGDNKVMPAGLAQLFAASIIVKMWPSKWEKEVMDADLIKDYQMDIGTRVRMNFKVTKNKTAPAMQAGSFDMFTTGKEAGQIDQSKYIMALAEKFGLFGSVGDGAKKMWKVGNKEFKTKKEAVEHITDPVVFRDVYDVLLKHLLG